MTKGELQIITILTAIKKYEVIEIKLNDKGHLEWTKKRTEKGEVDLHADSDRI